MATAAEVRHVIATGIAKLFAHDAKQPGIVRQTMNNEPYDWDGFRAIGAETEKKLAELLKGDSHG